MTLTRRYECQKCGTISMLPAIKSRSCPVCGCGKLYRLTIVGDYRKFANSSRARKTYAYQKEMQAVQAVL